MATVDKIDYAPPPPVKRAPEPPREQAPPPPPKEEAPPPPPNEPVAEKEVGGTVNVSV